MTLKKVVEESDTRAGRSFDLTVQALVLLSLVSFSIETLPDLGARFRLALRWVEIFTVALFTVEYGLRVAVADRKLGPVDSNKFRQLPPGSIEQRRGTSPCPSYRPLPTTPRLALTGVCLAWPRATASSRTKFMSRVSPHRGRAGGWETAAILRRGSAKHPASAGLRPCPPYRPPGR